MKTIRAIVFAVNLVTAVGMMALAVSMVLSSEADLWGAVVVVMVVVCSACMIVCGSAYKKSWPGRNRKLTAARNEEAVEVDPVLVMKNLRAVGNAMKLRCELDISYTNASGESSQRIVKPIKVLKSSAGAYLLYAYCTKVDERRYFRVDRIAKAVPPVGNTF